ncbi:hypothetical protein AAC387_Pa04g2400 [Persea americana]
MATLEKRVATKGLDVAMTLTARTMTSTTRSGSTTTTRKRLRWSWHKWKDEFVDDKVLDQGEEVEVWQMREEEEGVECNIQASEELTLQVAWLSTTPTLSCARNSLELPSAGCVRRTLCDL